jgi:DNA-binding transcriptional MerR regulator
MQYRIGEFARLAGVSIKTLRYYDAIGLLSPAAIDARTQYRLYASRQLQDVATIRSLKALGASLNEIRRVAGRQESRCERSELLRKLKRNALGSIESAQRTLAWIDDALEELHAEREVPIVLKQRAAIRVASVRAQAKSYAAIGALENDFRRAIDPVITGREQGVLWHRCAASGMIEGEPFAEISGRASRAGAYELKELPSATVASAYCEPDDVDAIRVYGALDRWLHVHGYRLNGPKREIYVGQILEVQFPVRAI